MSTGNVLQWGGVTMEISKEISGEYRERGPKQVSLIQKSVLTPHVLEPTQVTSGWIRRIVVITKRISNNVNIYNPLGRSDYNQRHFNINVKSENKNRTNQQRKNVNTRKYEKKEKDRSDFILPCPSHFPPYEALPSWFCGFRRHSHCTAHIASCNAHKSEANVYCKIFHFTECTANIKACKIHYYLQLVFINKQITILYVIYQRFTQHVVFHCDYSQSHQYNSD